MAHAQRALSHEENRNKICLLCMQKARYAITPIVLSRIKDYFIENYDINEACCPSAVCGKCLADLSDIAHGKKECSILPEVYDFGNIHPFLVSTTRNTDVRICGCIICETARVSGTKVPQRRKGRPPHQPNEAEERIRSVAVRLCCSCKSPVGRGLTHKCNLSTLRSNLLYEFDSYDSRTKDIVASNVIREKGSRNIDLQTRGPNTLHVNVGSCRNPNSFSSSDISMLQTSIGASNTSMVQKIMPTIRRIFGKKSVQAYTKQYLEERDKCLEDFFPQHI